MSGQQIQNEDMLKSDNHNAVQKETLLDYDD